MKSMTSRSCHVMSMRVCMCVRMCTHVCMINEITPFSGFSLSHYERTTYILMHLPNFLSYGTIFLFSYAQVMWRHVESPIRALNESTWCTLVRELIILK